MTNLSKNLQDQLTKQKELVKNLTSTSNTETNTVNSESQK